MMIDLHGSKRIARAETVYAKLSLSLPAKSCSSSTFSILWRYVQLARKVNALLCALYSPDRDPLLLQSRQNSSK